MFRIECTRQDFLNNLKQFRDYKVEDYNQSFIVKGGRGAISLLQPLFLQEVNRVANKFGDTISHNRIGLILRGDRKKYKHIDKLFITDYGWLMMEFDKTFDKFDNLTEEKFGYFPINSYNYQIQEVDCKNLNKIKKVGKFSSIKEEETVKIVSSTWSGDRPGIDDKKIYIKFNYNPFKKGDKICHNPLHNFYLYVLESENDMVIVKKIGDRFIPKSYLDKDIEYYKILRENI